MLDKLRAKLYPQREGKKLVGRKNKSLLESVCKCRVGIFELLADQV